MSPPCDTEILNTTIHQVRPDSEHPEETQSRDAARSRTSNVYLFCRHVGRGSRDKWNQEEIQRDTWGDVLQELAHAVMETEKSHRLLSVSQGTRKARGLIPSEFKGPKTREANGLSTRV